MEEKNKVKARMGCSVLEGFVIFFIWFVFKVRKTTC